MKMRQNKEFEHVKLLPNSTSLQDARTKVITDEQKESIRIANKAAFKRNLMWAKDEIEKVAGKLGLIQLIKDEALLIYKEAAEYKLTHGRSIPVVAAASLYAACRRRGLPITLDEIAEYSENSRKEIASCYRVIIRSVKIRPDIPNPVIYVEKIVKTLNLNPEVQKDALDIVTKAKEKGLIAGKDPAGFAGAAVYIACLQHRQEIVQKEIAIAAQVTEVTIRSRYKELMKKLGIVIQNPL
ncbi:MAG: hypothetical protein QW128_03515 [Thermoprotei archaeon]